MIGDNLRDALNQQITNELSAAYFYLSMAGYFESLSLPGFASWMRLQHQEETDHAMKIFNFVTDKGGRVTLGPIDAPTSEFDSVEAAIGQALEHERRVTADIYSLHEVAQQERDYAAHVLLEWFSEEQVEEEKTIEELLDHVRMVGDNGAGLLILDARLGSRTSAE